MEKKRLILWIAVILTLAFIFGQSLLDEDVSKKESTSIRTQVVEPVHKAITGEETLPYNVRDAAHILEFSILGLELVFLCKGNTGIAQGLRSISYCGFIALIDESIQYFSKRGPEVVDIWHDILGSVIGTSIGVLLSFYIMRRKRV